MALFDLKTSVKEVDGIVPFFEKLNHLTSDNIREIFPEKLKDHMIEKWLEEKKIGLRFYNRLDLHNQKKVCSYLRVDDEFIKVYKVQMFFNGIYTWYAPYMSKRIFGYTKDKFDNMNVISFYNELTIDEKEKLVQFINEHGKL